MEPQRTIKISSGIAIATMDSVNGISGMRRELSLSVMELQRTTRTSMGTVTAITACVNGTIGMRRGLFLPEIQIKPISFIQEESTATKILSMRMSMGTATAGTMFEAKLSAATGNTVKRQKRTASKDQDRVTNSELSRTLPTATDLVKTTSTPRDTAPVDPKTESGTNVGT